MNRTAPQTRTMKLCLGGLAAAALALAAPQVAAAPAAPALQAAEIGAGVAVVPASHRGGLHLYFGFPAPYYPAPYYTPVPPPPPPSYGGACAYWSDRCARNWGYGNSDYYGCLRYHRCY